MFSEQDQIQGYEDEGLGAAEAEERRQERHIELIALEQGGGGLSDDHPVNR